MSPVDKTFSAIAVNRFIYLQAISKIVYCAQEQGKSRSAVTLIKRAMAGQAQKRSIRAVCEHFKKAFNAVIECYMHFLDSL
jgi:hypothetical protein